MQAYTERSSTYTLPALAQNFGPPNVVTLSCTARAHVPKPERRDGCSVRAAFSGARAMAAGVTPRHATINSGGSAAGPAPGRDGFSGLLGGVLRRMCLLSCALRATRPAGIVEQAWPVLRTTLGVLFGHASFEAFSTALDTGNTDTDISGTTHPSLRP